MSSHWENSSRRYWENRSRQEWADSSRRYWDEVSHQRNGIAFTGNPEFSAYWTTLTLKQKIVGSLCSIAAGAAGAGVLIALVGFLH